MGIVNGTTNYILSAMVDDRDGLRTRRWPRRPGSATPRPIPTADVDGFDAAAKAAILASIGFHTRVGAADVHREGIADVSAADIAAAREIGCTVKLLAICERVVGHRSPRRSRRRAGGEAVSARVHPVMLPNTPSVGRRRRRLQRRLRRGRGGRSADVLRPRRRRGADGVRGARRPGRGGAQPDRRRARAAGVRLRGAADPADGRGARAGITSASTSTTGPACWPPWRPRSPRPACRSRRCGRRGGGDDASLVVVTHSAPDAALARHRRTGWRSWTRCTRSRR